MKRIEKNKVINMIKYIKDLFKSKKELDLRIEGYCFALFI